MLGAENLLVELSDARLGHGVHERPAFRNPPFRDALRQELLDVVDECIVGLDAFSDDEARHRPLVPFRVRHADHGRFENVRMGHDDVLEVDRGDPLAAGLDDVLRAVGDAEVAEFVEGAHVAGSQPPVAELLRCFVQVIGPGDPRTADFDLADRLAVGAGHDRIADGILGDDPELDTGQDAPGEIVVIHGVRGIGVLVGFRQRAEGGGLGHAPPLHDLEAVLVEEALHEHARHCRSARGDASQRREVDGCALAVVPDVVPDGGDSHGDRRARLLDERRKRSGLEELGREDEVGTGEEAGVRRAPGVGVEHRHDDEELVGFVEPEHRCAERGERMEVGRAVAVGNALRIAGGARRVTHCRGASLVGLDPLESGLFGGERVVVVHRRGARKSFREHRMIARTDDEEVGHVRQRPGDLAQQGDQRTVDDDHPVIGVVHHEGQLFREQADVQRVEHGAHRRDGEVGLEVLGMVPTEGGDPLITVDPDAPKGVGETPGVRGDFGVGGAFQGEMPGGRVVRRQRLHHRVTMDGLPAAENGGDGERVVLHRASHVRKSRFSADRARSR